MPAKNINKPEIKQTNTAPAGPMVVTLLWTNNAMIAVGPMLMSLQPPNMKYMNPPMIPLYNPYCEGRPRNRNTYCSFTVKLGTLF